MWRAIRPVDDIDDPSFNVYEYKREFNPAHMQRIGEHVFAVNKAFHSANQFPQRTRRTIKKSFPGLVNWLRRKSA